jgi:hypothetical protein
MREGTSNRLAVNRALVTTAFTLDGYRVVKNCGIVRGIVVRSSLDAPSRSV